jgi:hypothetical protein
MKFNVRAKKIHCLEGNIIVFLSTQFVLQHQSFSKVVEKRMAHKLFNYTTKEADNSLALHKRIY